MSEWVTEKEMEIRRAGNILIPETPTSRYKINCAICDKEFVSRHSHSKYCHDPCNGALKQKLDNEKNKKPKKARKSIVKERNELIELNNKYAGVRL